MQVVWFSEIKWDYLKTRKQQIISRKPADVQLLFLEPYVKGRRNDFGLRTEGDIFCATIPFIKSVPTFPWRNVLDQQVARRLVDFVARRRIRSLLKSTGFDSPKTGFIISNIYAADVALSLDRLYLLYDCNDDHAKFPGMRSWSETYFYKTTRHADAIFASAQALLDKVSEVRGGGDGVEYLGNGVDFKHFRAGAGVDAPRLPTDKPRLGYIGALAPWVDFDAMESVAKAHPEFDLVLVGPILHGAEGAMRKLTELTNVWHLAPVAYDRLPGILHQFSVGLIPFRYNELTRGVNPNKLYEYLAAGLPVVTTRFSEEVTRCPDLVKAVDPGEAFNAACAETVRELSDENAARAISERSMRAARENDWDVIAETFWKRVETMHAERS